MTDNKKRRMSMLDNLAATGAPIAVSPMMSSNRALRSARDAVDAHNVWDLDPFEIEDARFSDRLDPKDVADLRATIEANGQTVPILVRRHPTETDKYLLVYGRRRLEAVKSSNRVKRVRALIANLDESAALRAQVSENTGRRDLSYIERALFARELLESNFGNQAQIAEVLNVTKSAISMAISVATAVGSDLARAIGPAMGIGRPRWEDLAKALTDTEASLSELVAIASDARAKAAGADLADGQEIARADPSSAAFEAVARRLQKSRVGTFVGSRVGKARALRVDGVVIAQVQSTAKGVRLDLNSDKDGFAAWFESQSQSLIEELHGRWKQRT